MNKTKEENKEGWKPVYDESIKRVKLTIPIDVELVNKVIQDALFERELDDIVDVSKNKDNKLYNDYLVGQFAKFNDSAYLSLVVEEIFRKHYQGRF